MIMIEFIKEITNLHIEKPSLKLLKHSHNLLIHVYIFKANHDSS